MEHLPPVIRSPAAPEGEDWRAAAAGALRDEARSPTVGGSAIVNRLLESLLADAIRAELVRASDGAVAPADALTDRRIGRVLLRIHESPEEQWTVERLAGIAAMSRSAFASRFRVLVGEAPMQYVTRHRLERARRFLRSTDLTVAEIARRVGYASESALSRALKSSNGEGPSEVRRRSPSAHR
jgi:transcriptional regulator GlxA family with amidase domain